MKYLRTVVLAFLMMGIFVPCFAGLGNIAPGAKVTASSEITANAAKNATDGIIGVDGSGEWVCKADTAFWGYIRFPWIQLEWDSAQWVNKLVLFDRVTLLHNVGSVKISFSDGSVEWVRQLPADGSGMAVVFPARKTKWIHFEVFDGTGGHLGFSEIEVYPSPEQFQDYVGLVDPYIETNKGRYEFFITGSLPFGMATSAPLTRNKHQYGGGYNYNEREILGFQQIHNWMLSGIEIMPATTAQNPGGGRQSWKSTFNHDDEIVQPGYHRVMLQQNKIWVEQTATERVNYYKFIYTKKSAARIIIDLGATVFNCSSMIDARVNKISDREIEGSFNTVKRLWGGPNDVQVFFYIQFDKPFKSLDAWQGNKSPVSVQQNASGDSLVLAAGYEMAAGEQLHMKIAISYTSVENARNNLMQECKTLSFEETRNNARNVWNSWLGRISVKGGTNEQRVKFYTDLWHVLLGRQKINDVSGDYPDRTEIIKRGGRNGNFSDAVFKIKTLPKDSNGQPRFNMYTSDAFWLTQWNLNVLWSLAWPEVMDDMSASLLEYAKNGGLLPRGPFGGGYSFIMSGDPAANLIAGTYMKGLLTKAEPANAFDAVKRNQLPGGMLGSKPDVEFYTEKGWWPGSAGVTIEASFQDWSAAQMALKLGLKKDFEFFRKRASGWEHCFDTALGLIFPKDRNGKFSHKNPLSGAGWIESNSWQGTWGVSHDIAKLAKKMGGNDSFCNKLNYAFEKSRLQNFVAEYSDGYVSYGNQPGCSNAHVFSYAGKPWLTQYWVRRVKTQTYGGTSPDEGYGGHDEDEGQMGGISALMAIGLFDIMGGVAQQPVYEITSPVFDEVTVKLNNKYYSGKEFVIKTHHNSATNDYIQSAKLNGKSWNNFWLTHEDFAKGGRLELWLGAKPNKKWGIAGLPPACSNIVN